MQHIEQEVVSVNVFDVAVIGVSPPCGPRVDNFKPVAGILEAGLTLDDYRTLDSKGVLAAEAGAEFIVRDVNPFTRGAAVTFLHLLASPFVRGLGCFLLLLFRGFGLVFRGFCLVLLGFLFLRLWLFSRFLRASKSRKQQEENRGRNSDPVHGLLSPSGRFWPCGNPINCLPSRKDGRRSDAFLGKGDADNNLVAAGLPSSARNCQIPQAPIVHTVFILCFNPAVILYVPG